ncbi:unnamed protein product [Leptosia nina]|uniref:Serpin domain-containing protein n=1 Tax=Leptosia nina TaxID=320188 RepID=A0AAV1JZL8_9NEOP
MEHHTTLINLHSQNLNWLSSPLAGSLLLSLIIPGRRLEKYTKLYKQLKGLKGFDLRNRIFISPNCKLKHTASKGEVTEFDRNGATAVSEWLNKYGFKDYDIHTFCSKSDYMLINLTKFQMSWNRVGACGPIVTVYNSFNYTEDVKYEARLIEIPLENKEFKLVIPVPNEIDILKCLVKKLNDEGLSSAVKSIQPLFTAVSELKAPEIEYEANTEFSIEQREFDSPLVQMNRGSVKVNNEGIIIDCVTCILPSQSHREKSKLEPVGENAVKPFLFSILFRDTAIFSGRCELGK